MRPTRPDLEQAALLVIDMQEHFREIAAPVLETLPGLLDELRARHVPVIYTQHGHEDVVRDAGMLGEWWDEHIVVGTPDWELLPEVAPQPGEAVVPKKRYSAFADTELEALLHERGVTSLLIAGVMTNLCCETTARDAFVRDFRVFFLADGTATASPAFQEASLLNLAFGFATVLRCRDVVP